MVHQVGTDHLLFRYLNNKPVLLHLYTPNNKTNANDPYGIKLQEYDSIKENNTG
jgi:hypothetical protein